MLFVGHDTRAEIVSNFEKGLTSATQDLNAYKELCPENVLYDAREKKYFQSEKFKPLFKHDPRKTLIKLAHQITDGFDSIGDTQFPVEAPSQLNVPNIFVVAPILSRVPNFDDLQDMFPDGE